MTFGTMERIQTVTVPAGGQANIEFTNIPQTYDDLVVKFSTRNPATGVGAWQFFDIGFNGVLTNRSITFLGGAGTFAVSGTNTAILGQSSAGDSTASTFSNGEIYIPNYRASTAKSISIDQVTENNAASALIYPTAARWNSTAAITSIQLANNYAGSFAQHSTATLYGITRIPAGAKATGGVIYDDATHWYHVFTSSDVFSPNQSLSCDVLVIAGGGGGTSNRAGGGGAGGYTATTATYSTNQTVTIGAGGAIATNGSTSSIGSTSTTGGGAGGAWIAGNGATGGSGGGGAGSDSQGIGTGGSPVSGQGFAGGNGFQSPADAASGGGGGAGGVGGNGSASGGGAGGTGATWLDGVIRGGGGGGGIDTRGGNARGVGGAGGGGSGAGLGAGNAAVAGTANTGGGGGGGADADQSGNFNGAAGGSGIVIVRYAK